MVISNRIRTAAEMVTSRGVAADIGCDHCLSLIYIISSGLCEKGIGTDINKGPLERAKDNVILNGLTDKIELRQGNGLTVLKEGEADTIIVAGMGGLLINTIINNSLNVAKDAGNLILQPHSDVPAVRKNLHKNGFIILDEKMIYENGKYYITIKTSIGVESYNTDADYLFGKILIDQKCRILKDYLKILSGKNLDISAKITDKKADNCVLRLAEIDKMNTLITEVLRCL